MKLQAFRKVRDGKYLKNYELTYLNKHGKEKVYEIVSRNELTTPGEIGLEASGVSIIATVNHKLLLLKEFRMGVNREVYNLCAGMLETGEAIEDCIRRELFEETGLHVKCITKILPPSFAAVAISDTSTYIAFIEAEGNITSENASDNEWICADLYDVHQVEDLLSSDAPFSSRAQIAAYFFSLGCLPNQ